MGQDDVEPVALQNANDGGAHHAASDAAFARMDEWTRFASSRATEFSRSVEDEAVS